MFNITLSEERFGEYITFQRKSINLRESELAKKCNFSRQYICDIENARRIPSEDAFCVILKYFTIDYYALKERSIQYLQQMDDFIKYLIFAKDDKVKACYQKLCSEADIIYKDHIVALEFKVIDIIYKTYFEMEELSQFDELSTQINSTVHIELQSLFHLFHAVALLNRGLLYECDPIINKAVDDSNDYDIKGLIFYYMGLYEDYSTHYITAIRCNERAIKHFTDAYNYIRTALVECHISGVYANCGEYNKAETRCKSILSSAIHDDNKTIIAECTSQLAMLAFQQENYLEVVRLLTDKKYTYATIRNAFIMAISLISTEAIDQAKAIVGHMLSLDHILKDKALSSQFECLTYYFDSPDSRNITSQLEHYATLKSQGNTFVAKLVLDILIDYYRYTRQYKKVYYYMKEKHIDYISN